MTAALLPSLVFGWLVFLVVFLLALVSCTEK